VHVGSALGGTHGDSDLRVIDAREVAGTGRLVLFGLERERVRVDTGVGGAGVMVEGLHLVEVLTLLLLETVLAVKDELEAGQGTNGIFGEDRSTADLGTKTKHGRTISGEGDEGVGGGHTGQTSVKLDIVVVRLGGEVPHRVGVGGNVREAPHQLLDGVVVRQADLLGGIGVDGVGTGVLNLFDQVFVTLLGEAATLLGVQVDVVGPHLEDTGVEPRVESRRQITVEADLMVLESDQRQVQTGVAVEEEEEGEVDGLGRDTGGHLTVSSLLGVIQVKLRVQTPPLLVVFVNSLPTNGQFDVVDTTLGDPGSLGLIHTSLGLEFDVHVTNEVTVTGDSDGHATRVGGSTVDGLLDVLHREVSVALVFRLEESYLGVTGKVDVLGAISYELHKTTSHFVLLYYTQRK